MAMREESQDDEYEYDQDDDISLDTQAMNSGEGIKSQDAVDRFFNTEALLFHFKMSLLGYITDNGKYKNTGRGIAKTETINKMINSLRRIINTENMLSYKKDEEINYILLENCKEQIYSIYDDETVNEDDVEHIVNMLDHPAEMFMGIVKSGDGSEAARQILTGNYMRLNEKGEGYNPSFRVGTQNRDLFTVWGERK